MEGRSVVLLVFAILDDELKSATAGFDANIGLADVADLAVNAGKVLGLDLANLTSELRRVELD